MPEHVPRPPRSPRFLAVALLAAVTGALPAAAQQAQPTVDDTYRLFQRFVEDGAISPHVWLEGQVRMQTNSPVFGPGDGDRWTTDAVLGLGLTEELEVGLRLGLIHLDPDAGDSDNGLSDIEVHAKYRLDELPLDIVVGGIVKIPTADEDEGLGTGELDFEGFGAVRKDLGHVSLIGNAGLRFNGDPDGSVGVDTKTSILLGGGLIIGLTSRIHNSWELTYESKRFEGGETDVRLTPGLGWRLGNRGLFRAAVGIGLSDGAPDFEAIAGLVLTY